MNKFLHKLANEYGARPDGTAKSTGWLGVHKADDGSDVSEYSVGVNIGGRQQDIPTLTPYSTPEDVRDILESASNRRPPGNDAVRRAYTWARYRIGRGLSPFFNNNKQDILLRDKLLELRKKQY